MTRYDVVIVGGGHGGAGAAIELRKCGFTGSIAIVGDEAELPYERPPLSKDYLAQEKPFERILIRPATFWAERDIAMLVGQRVVSIDPEARTLVCADGTALIYGGLIWAAGGRARRLRCEGHDLAGVHTVRTRADVDRLIAELPAATRVVVIGGGYIGLEAAAVLVRFGKMVTLIEAQDRLLARVAGADLSAFYAAEHRAHGVDVRLGTAVDRMLGANGRVAGVRLHDGEDVSADIIVVGIGIDAEIDPLTAAGAESAAGGVLVDSACRTTLPHIFAVGDCAAAANRYADGAVVRIESVQNAQDQAIVAARTIVGITADYDAMPWFWSNQYDLKLQTIGLSAGHDRAILRGSTDARRFSIGYFRDGRLIALDCVNAIKDYVQCRGLIGTRLNPDVPGFADSAIPLKSLQTDAWPVGSGAAPACHRY